MSITVLLVLLFVVVLALCFSLLYLAVEVPLANRAMRIRLEAIEELEASPVKGSETDLLRQDVLSRVSILNRLFVKIPALTRLNLFIQQSGLRITVGMLLLASSSLALFAYLAGWLLKYPALVVISLMLGFGCIPFLAVAYKRQRRFRKLEEQFPDALDLLARSVRAGHAFTTGLQLIGSELPEPVAVEFRSTWEQQNFGLPLRDALNNLMVRVPLPDMNVFVTALVIQRESGGNLAEILDNLSRVIRERFKLARQVRVYTAQGRISMFMLVAMPPLVALMLILTSPDYICPLFSDPLGVRMLAAAVILQLVGTLVILKIIQPKI